MRQDEQLQNRILYILGLIPTIWLALMVAPNLNNGLVSIITGFTNSMNNTFKISWCENSIKSILIFLLIYIMIIAIYESTKKNYRRREEHGSAKWGIASQLNKKYMQKFYLLNLTNYYFSLSSQWEQPLYPQHLLIFFFYFLYTQLSQLFYSYEYSY